MTKDQAYRLLRFTVVMRDGDPTKRGTVTETGAFLFVVNWESAPAEFVPYHQAQHVSMWEPEAKP